MSYNTVTQYTVYPNDSAPYNTGAGISAYNLTHPDFNSRLYDPHTPTPNSSESSESPQTPLLSDSSSPSSAKGKIARPSNAFILYRSWWLNQRKISEDAEKIPEGAEKIPEGAEKIPEDAEKRQQKLSCVVGVLWGKLDKAEKDQWRLKAEQRRDEHKKAHPGYKFTPSRRASRGNKAKAQAMTDDDDIVAEKTKALRETYTKYLGPSPTPSRRKHAKKARRESESGIVPPSHWSAPSSTQPLSMPIHSSSTSLSGPYQNQNPMFFPQPQFTQDHGPSSSIGFFNDPQQHSLTDLNATANQSDINAFNCNIINSDQNMVYGNLDAADLASQMNGLNIMNNLHNTESFGLLPDIGFNFTDSDMTAYMSQSPDFFASWPVGLDFQSSSQFDYTFS